MLSLDNTYSQEEVGEFVARVQKLLPGETLEWLLEPKVDGVAINLRYENGVFAVGSTRGDGTTGDDVTANLENHPQHPDALARHQQNRRAEGDGSARGSLFDQGGFCAVERRAHPPAGEETAVCQSAQCRRRVAEAVGCEIGRAASVGYCGTASVNSPGKVWISMMSCWRG